MQDRWYIKTNKYGDYYLTGIENNKAIIKIHRGHKKQANQKSISSYKLTIKENDKGYYVKSYNLVINIDKQLKEMLNNFKLQELDFHYVNVVKCNCGGHLKAIRKDVVNIKSEYLSLRGKPVGETTYETNGEATPNRFVCEKCGMSYYKADLKYLKRERVKLYDRSDSRA